MRRMTRSVYSGFVASLGWSPTHSRRAGGPSCERAAQSLEWLGCIVPVESNVCARDCTRQHTEATFKIAQHV